MTDMYPGLRMAAEDRSRSREAYELDLHKRAMAGDKKAGLEIKARDAMSRANARVSDLRLAAAKGDDAAMRTLEQIAGGSLPVSPPASSGQSGSRRFSESEVGLAVSSAIKRERNRISAVFASDASIGRERGCASLLCSSKGWSGAQILAELPSLPTDKEVLGSGNRRTSSDTDALWERAYARSSPTASSSAAAPSTQEVSSARKLRGSSDDMWSRAYERAAK